MKNVLKYLGVVIIIIAVLLLGYVVIAGMNDNTLLFTSLVMVVVGFFSEIFLFRLYSN